MKFGIIVFPGSNCDDDCRHVISGVMGHEAFFLWYKSLDLNGADCLVLPGGFSYGDYLRCGSMAANAPIMNSVKSFADSGGLVIGICNGFQILQEAGLLPGTLIRNINLKFICKDVHVRVERNNLPFTSTCKVGEVLKLPIAHMEGNFFADKKTLSRFLDNGQIFLRYCDADGKVGPEANPNGSAESIAGITNEKGNVCGLMPHPERCAEAVLKNRDGLKIFDSIISHLGNR